MKMWNGVLKATTNMEVKEVIKEYVALLSKYDDTLRENRASTKHLLPSATHLQTKMDKNTNISQLSLGDCNNDSVADGLRKKEQWNGPKFQDTASSNKKEAKIFTFYRMENEGEHYLASCYV
nr:hypothetical protein [Tanacetum cinerariifolium]